MKVLIYNGEHSAQRGPYNTAEALQQAGIEYKFIQNISAPTLAGYDVLVMPGGDGGRAYLNHFTTTSKQAIKDFVYNGGGYYGTCAGAYLAVKSVYDGSTLFYNGLGVAPNLKAQAVYTDTDSIAIKFIEPECKQIGKSSSTQYMAHYQGPALYTDNVAGPVMFAKFNNQYRKDTYGYGAMVADYFGKGITVLSSPHPELEPKDYKLVVNLIKFAAKKSDGGTVMTDLSTSTTYQIKAADFKLMIAAVEAWLKMYTTSPERVMIRKDGVKSATNYITYTKYQEMKTRWDAYLKANNTEPTFIWINKTTPTPTPTPDTVGPIQKSIQDATGKTWTSLTDFYNKIVIPDLKYCSPWYFESVKTLNQSKNAIINNIKGTWYPNSNQHNCCDFTRFLVCLGREMGYTVIPYGLRCESYGINHAVALVKGKEFTGRTCYINGVKTEGIIVDLSAGAEDHAPIGQFWCNNNNATRQPGWITPMC